MGPAYFSGEEQSNPVLYRACLYGAADRFIVFKFLQTTAKVNEVSMLKQNTSDYV
jgi:hypothetical protein